MVPVIKPTHHRADVKSSCLALTVITHEYRDLFVYVALLELSCNEQWGSRLIADRWVLQQRSRFIATRKEGSCIPKNKSLVRQVQDVLKSKLRIGKPKHIAKKQGKAFDGIYSWSTYENYLAKACDFVKWAKEYHAGGSGSIGVVGGVSVSSVSGSNGGVSGSNSVTSSDNIPRTLEDCRKYADVYLQKHIDEGYSPYTQKLIACALAKLYGCSTMDFIPTQVRHRANITRSRKCKDNGKGKAKFSESRNQEFVDFCRATGLRRHEIKQLKPENLGHDEITGRYMLINIKGKGGKVRECPIVSYKEGAVDMGAIDMVVNRMKNTPAGQLIWSKIPSRADIHSYRADYCRVVYEQHARPINMIPKNERYHCRSDLKGVVYDKRAMAVASRALGHNRIGVIAGHYLGGKDGGINF